MFTTEKLKVNDITINDKVIYVGCIEQATAIFIFVCLMHKNGTISDARLKAEFKKIRTAYKASHTPRSMGYKRTYHCSINDVWYNDMSYYDIIQSVYDSSELSRYMLDINDLIKYANLCFNKTRNWCLDWIWQQIIKDRLELAKQSHIDINDIVKVLTTSKLDIQRKEPYASYDPGMYCCSDCDGPYEAYKRMHYERHCKTDITEVENAFKYYLQTLRKSTY